MSTAASTGGAATPASAGGSIASQSVKMFISGPSTGVYEAVRARLDPDMRSDDPQPFAARIPDFDDVAFEVVVAAGSLSTIKVSMSMPCWKDLQASDVETHLKSVYGDMMVPATAPNNVAVAVSVEKHGSLAGWSAAATLVASLRRHAMAAPFVKAFGAVLGGTGATAPSAVVRFRPREPILIMPRGDRVIIIYALHFGDPTDRAMARIIAQEFVESTRTVANAPPCAFTDRDREAPGELRGHPDVPAPGAGPDTLVGYLSFGVFTRHFDNEAKREAVITQLAHFHPYLDYHIKAAKSHLHARMRARVDGWMQVLNRAQPDDPFASKDKKLASGKAFLARK